VSFGHFFAVHITRSGAEAPVLRRGFLQPIAVRLRRQLPHAFHPDAYDRRGSCSPRRLLDRPHRLARRRITYLLIPTEVARGSGMISPAIPI